MKYQVGNTIAFAVMILMNSLANILPINGKTTGELSDQYPNLFVPVGITFSIWGVIYLLLFAFVVVQFFARFRDRVVILRWTVICNFILNALWIVTWHYEFVGLSLLIMAALLVTLIVINYKLQYAGWFMQLSFGIYFGWICLATIANTTALLVALSWTRFGISEQTWSVIMIVVGTIIGAASILRLTNPFLALALIWGFYGIVLKRQVDYQAIAISSYLGMVITGAAAIWIILKGKAISQIGASTI